MSVMVAKARSMSASGAREDRARINLSEGSEILSGVQVPRAAGDALDRPHRYRATPPRHRRDAQDCRTCGAGTGPPP